MQFVASWKVRVVVDDVLDFSALSAGKMRLRKTSVPLQDMLSEVVRLHSSNAAKKGVKLSLATMCERVPQQVLLDRLRMQQVISNVISNAIKFTEEGGSVTLVVSVLPNKLSSNMAYYNIDVVDTGEKLPPRLPCFSYTYCNVEHMAVQKRRHQRLA
jgi:signal transduction histidine kinase